VKAEVSPMEIGFETLGQTWLILLFGLKLPTSASWKVVLKHLGRDLAYTPVWPETMSRQRIRALFNSSNN
jgi:hypothetical protein